MTIKLHTSFSLSALVLASVLASSAHAAIVETYEAPGVTNTTTTFIGAFGVESFDAQPASGGFTSDFGGAASSYTGAYSSGTEIRAANQYGGAGGVGSYAVTFSGSSYSLTLNKTATYFGFWLSAADPGNVVSFYNGQTLVGELDQTKLTADIGANAAYYGNPSSAFQGQNGNETYAFVNFYDTDAAGFDRIVFSENGALAGGFAGYESDNHTIGNYASMTGTVSNTSNSVPEPGSCALAFVALAGVGATSARRKSRRD